MLSFQRVQFAISNLGEIIWPLAIIWKLKYIFELTFNKRNPYVETSICLNHVTGKSSTWAQSSSISRFIVDLLSVGRFQTFSITETTNKRPRLRKKSSEKTKKIIKEKKQGSEDGKPLKMPLSDYLKIVIDTVKAPFTPNVSFLSYFTVNFPQIIALGHPPYRSNSKLRH